MVSSFASSKAKIVANIILKIKFRPPKGGNDPPGFKCQTEINQTRSGAPFILGHNAPCSRLPDCWGCSEARSHC